MRRAVSSARSPARFAVGVALLGASFLVYLVYPVILLLAASGEAKVVATVAASLVSWGVFAAGLYLAGKPGYRWLRRRLTRGAIRGDGGRPAPGSR